MLARCIGVIAGVGVAAVVVARILVVAEAPSLDPPAFVGHSASCLEPAPRPTTLAAAAAGASSAPARCYLLGHEQTGLLASQLLELCEGAPTPSGPVECYLTADDHGVSVSAQRLSLCRCADSTAPVECFVRMRSETSLFDYQIEQLCAPQRVYGLLPNCRPMGGL